jgi:uncharacterized 2Fe-2S/4Fe-4S cluster protein (DUF4445 family)
LINIANNIYLRKIEKQIVLKYLLGIDIGTTIVAGVLIKKEKNESKRRHKGDIKQNLSDSKTVVAEKSILNLQYPEFGLDSIKRIQNGLDESSVKKLQERAILTINALIENFQKDIAFNFKGIEAVAIAGNTVMEMALCGYPLSDLSKPPYKPASNIIFPKTTGKLPVGLPLLNIKNAKVFIFPILGGFVGGDAVSSLYYLDFYKRAKPVFLADFGTNVEIAIGNKDKIFCTSAPAGPAFEGGNIRYGMLAEDSAIYSIEIEGGIFKIKTINGSKTPRGICGSGIIDLIASLLREKVIDKNGRILPPELIESESYSIIDKKGNENEVVLYRDKEVDIRFFQDDVRQFQFAKSAIKSATEILLEKFKILPDDDFDVYISGSFGSHIKPENIDIIDIFPFKGKTINFIPDSALLGCQKYLTSKAPERKHDISTIMNISKNFPLSGSKLFEKYFIKNTVWM